MNSAERKADDQYEAENDVTGNDAPSGIPNDDTYVSGGPVPVQKDDAPVEDPIDNPKFANSDAQLGE